MDSGAEDEMDVSTNSQSPLVDVQAWVDSIPVDPIGQHNESDQVHVDEHAGGDSRFGLAPMESDSRDQSQMGAADDSQAGGAAEATTNPANYHLKNCSNFLQDEAGGGLARLYSPVHPESDSNDSSQMGSAGDSQADRAVDVHRWEDSIDTMEGWVFIKEGLGLKPEQVEYGGPEEAEELARDLGQIKYKNVKGQDGILFDEKCKLQRCEDQRTAGSPHKKFRIADRKYRAGYEYTRLQLLGKGCSGTVQLIQDNHTKEFAAEKSINLRDFSPNEILNWCRLINPFIVKFLGVIRTDLKVMYYSEYRAGYETLKYREQHGIRVDQKQALILMDQLFQALVCLKRNNIAHLDIHARNILINNAADHISLIDFGRSRQITEIKSGDPDDRFDVWQAIQIFIRLLGGSHMPGCKLELPPETDWRLRDFVQWAVKRPRPRADEVLVKIKGLKEHLDSIGATVTGPPTDDCVPPEN